MRELTHLREEVAIWEEVSARIADALELAELDDQEIFDELAKEVDALQRAVDKLEFRTLFAGKYDSEPAILAIHAGAGGTEAQDWAQMLQRMFSRWAANQGFKLDIIDASRT